MTGEKEVVVPSGYAVGSIVTNRENVIVKDGQAIDLLDLVVELANKIDRAGLK